MMLTLITQNLSTIFTLYFIRSNGIILFHAQLIAIDCTVCVYVNFLISYITLYYWKSSTSSCLIIIMPYRSSVAKVVVTKQPAY